ncbi:hypothetical protein R80B4_00700 [Fibrobacteres bacterium R8-0-B4]
MRKLIAVAMVAGLLGAASAVSAQGWSIGFEGRFSNNFGGGFKGDVTSPVTDTNLVLIERQFVSVQTSLWRCTTTVSTTITADEVTTRRDTIVIYYENSENSGLVGDTAESVTIIKRAMPDTKEMYTPTYSGGAGVFLASKYAEATVGLTYTGGTWKRKVVGKNAIEPTYTRRIVMQDTVRTRIIQTADSAFSVDYASKRAVLVDTLLRETGVNMNSEWERDITALNLNIGLWLKYPYELSETVKLFPIAGIEYEICTLISKEIRMVWAANTWSRTWFKAGIGGDFDVSERIYIHPVAMYGVGWKNSLERAMKNEGGVMVDTRISHGFSARIGIGYRFDAD